MTTLRRIMISEDTAAKLGASSMQRWLESKWPELGVNSGLPGTADLERYAGFPAEGTGGWRGWALIGEPRVLEPVARALEDYLGVDLVKEPQIGAVYEDEKPEVIVAGIVFAFFLAFVAVIGYVGYALFF